MSIHRIVGDFEILREIGRGGMGVVYEAEQLSLQRRVALKVLPAHLTLRPETVERFEREAWTAARLKHPGIVAIHAVGSQEGTHFFAMDLIEGIPLSEWMARQGGSASGAGVDTNPIESICKIVAQVADALEHAHMAGVIHRDVKPSNILLRSDGRAILTDFGLARAEGLPSITLTGEFAGTPYYVSPEQAMSRRMRLDHRTDVYSLGVTLYELLTRRRPFEGKSSQEVLGKIMTKEPPLPRSVNPRIPRDVETICLHAMEKDPDRRYPTAAAMAEDLRAFLEYRPITAQTVGWPTRVRRWMRRNQTLTALAALLLVGTPLVAALAGYILAKQPEIAAAREQARRDRVEEALQDGYVEIGEGSPTNAVKAFTAALRDDPKCVEAVAGTALAHLRRRKPKDALTWLDKHAALAAEQPSLEWARVGALDAGGRGEEAAALAARLGEPQNALDAFVAGSVALRKGEAGDPQAFQRALELMGRAVVNARHARALYHFEWAHAAAHAKDVKAVHACVAALEVNWPDSSGTWFSIGFARSSIGESKAALAAYRRSVELDPKLLTPHFNIAKLLRAEGDSAGAADEYRRALELDPEDAVTHSELGLALASGGDLTGAIAELQRAIEMNPSYTIAHDNLGLVFQKSGNLSSAILEFRKAVDLDPGFVAAHTNLGLVYYESGDLPNAIASFRRAIELDAKDVDAHAGLAKALYESRDARGAIAAHRRVLELEPNSASSLRGLGAALRDTNDLDGAVEALRRSLELDNKSEFARMNLGLALASQGKLEDAIAEFRQMIERNPKYPKAHVNLGMALYKSGRYDDAIGEYHIAIDLDPTNSAAWHNLGAVLHKTGDLTRAREALRRAIELAPAFETSHRALRTVLADAGDVAAERAELERWTSVKPNDAAAWNNLAWFLVNPEGKPEQRDPAAALPAARKAVELSKGKVPSILDTLAHALFLTGDTLGAVDTSEKAIALAKSNVKPNAKLIQNMEAARDRFRAGAASRPASAPAR